MPCLSRQFPVPWIADYVQANRQTFILGSCERKARLVSERVTFCYSRYYGVQNNAFYIYKYDVKSFRRTATYL